MEIKIHSAGFVYYIKGDTRCAPLLIATAVDLPIIASIVIYEASISLANSLTA